MGRSGTSSVPLELIRIASPPAGMTGFADAMAPSFITDQLIFVPGGTVAISGEQRQHLAAARGQDHALGQDAADLGRLEVGEQTTVRPTIASGA
jgi:hypothetical protein